MNKAFHIYRSSAGSGKTRTLAKEYLTLALTSKYDYFKHILAVTFTNKATQEMKDRILLYLNDFASGTKNELGEELKKKLNLDDQTFIQNSQEVRSAILHKYSQFSISTIDAFFQKVIRSFTRESGLVGDYRLEIDQDAVLEEVIGNLIDELGDNKQLTQWVVDFATENLENDRAWDVRYNLQSFAQQIFREEFKRIEDELMASTANPEFFNDLIKELKKRKSGFLKFVKEKSDKAVQIIKSNGLDEVDFKYGNGGVYRLFQKASKINRVNDFNEDEKGKRSEKEYQDINNWPNKDTPNKTLTLKLASEELLPLLQEILAYWHENFRSSLSSELVLNHFYAFGLLADISRKLNEYKSQNNLMLLADAPKFLHGIIQDSDTPFIYEKVGSFYRNYLIDEFQDTSGYQWKNFLPLLKNGIDQGLRSVVVGDVKQAVYRWRGGDLKLLQQGVEKSIGEESVKITELGTNFRSAIHVVDFNNQVFKTASHLIAQKADHILPAEAFKDVAQKISKTEIDGYVQIEFIREDSKEEKWKEKALEKVPLYLEELQSKGIPLKDIAILVRKNDEGQKIASYLLQYNAEQAKPGFRYDVISNESLRLDGAATVNLLLGAMKYLLNAEDAIARAQLAYEYAKLHEPDKIMSEVFLVSDAFFEHNLPDAFTKEKMALKKLPLFELTETLIEIFKLGNQEGELTYLLAFQDLVLDFFSRERNDLGAFLTWWEENKHKKSIQISGDVDAVQIFSIHKSKGLQFKYVIIPFCSWSMDHDPLKAPLLWVKSEEEPFQSAGYLPVAYSSTLKETSFSPYYFDEFANIHLDNLNLLYVALTRAEIGMLICAPHPKSAKGYSVSTLLHETIATNNDLKKDWNETEQCWKKGTLMTFKSTSQKTEESVSLSHYQVGRWREKLVIKQSAKGYFDFDGDEPNLKISYGIHMHAVLSRLQYQDELQETLQRILYEGLITENEREPLHQQMMELLSNDQVSNWFSKEWEVKTEVPILLPDGEEKRIDRLLLKDKHAVVIDFKTGEPTRTDMRQVSDYMNILRQMNFIEVEGYLLYLKNNEIIQVSTGRTKATQKKDDQQLGLGL